MGDTDSIRESNYQGLLELLGLMSEESERDMKAADKLTSQLTKQIAQLVVSNLRKALTESTVETTLIDKEKVLARTDKDGVILEQWLVLMDIHHLLYQFSAKMTTELMSYISDVIDKDDMGVRTNTLDIIEQAKKDSSLNEMLEEAIASVEEGVPPEALTKTFEESK